jgi:hypothetical protein
MSVGPYDCKRGGMSSFHRGLHGAFTHARQGGRAEAVAPVRVPACGSGQPLRLTGGAERDLRVGQELQTAIPDIAAISPSPIRSTSSDTLAGQPPLSSTNCAAVRRGDQ